MNFKAFNSQRLVQKLSSPIVFEKIHFTACLIKDVKTQKALLQSVDRTLHLKA